jgi:hypothetical protein
MAQLTWATQPGAVDLPDANLAADQPLTDYDLTKISNNAKFGAVRVETFYGWYKNGETALLPVSPVDGYAYSRQELEYSVAAFCSRSPAGATNGALARPSRQNANDGPGSLFLLDYWIEEKTDTNPGLVHLETHYWDGSTETVTNGGFVKVRTVAVRLSG